MKFDTKQFGAKAAQTNTAGHTVTRKNQTWMVDFAMLDLDLRPSVMMVIDVHTRRPLSATVSLLPATGIAATLNRLVRHSGRPEYIWIDNGFGYRLHTTLRAFMQQHGVTIIYYPTQTPQMKAVSEPALRDLYGFLRDKRFPRLMELGHDIERWRQSYTAAERPLPDVNQ